MGSASTYTYSKKAWNCVENIYYTIAVLFYYILYMRSEASKARQNAYYKEWYQRNKEKRREANRKRREENKEKVANYQKDYYKNNREKLNIQHARWQKESWYYEKNKERIIEKAKEYYHKNKALPHKE